MSSKEMSAQDLEEGNGGSQHIDHSLKYVPTNMSISPEMFEKLYLQPQRAVKGDLRKILANPTPLALMGFSVALTPLSIALMGWRGSGGGAVATVGATLWFGGVLLIIAGALEFLLGNTFPFTVFMGYGCHYLTFGTTFMPFFNAVAAFNKAGSTEDLTPMFEASFGFYTLAMAILSAIFLLCALRTNLVFVLIFVAATLGFGCATGAYWQLSQGNADLGTTLIVGTGGCFFAAALLGWYMFLAVMLQEMQFPLPDLPVMDLSTKIKAKTGRKDMTQAQKIPLVHTKN